MIRMFLILALSIGASTCAIGLAEPKQNRGAEGVNRAVRTGFDPAFMPL